MAAEKEKKKKIGRPVKWTEKELEKLGKELIECVKEDGVWHISEFSERHEKSKCWLNELEGRSKIFSKYVTRAREILGRKMFEYGMEKNPNAWMLKTWMPRFLGEREYHLDDVKEETLIKAEAARDAMTKDPDHPFWKEFTKYIGEQQNGKSSSE